MAPNYKPRVCEICGEIYKPVSSVQKYCKNCAPSTSDKKAYNQFWTKLNPYRTRMHKIKSYQEKKKDPNFIPENNRKRRERRAKIQQEWGRVGGPKGTFVNFEWEKSEEFSLSILKQRGFDSPKRLSYFAHCPFDVRAEKDGKIHVFQITMRTHLDDKKRHLQLAKDLGLEYNILYLKPDFSGYVFKSAEGSGADELCLRDLREMIELK